MPYFDGKTEYNPRIKNVYRNSVFFADNSGFWNIQAGTLRRRSGMGGVLVREPFPAPVTVDPDPLKVWFFSIRPSYPPTHLSFASGKRTLAFYSAMQNAPIVVNPVRLPFPGKNV